MLSGTPASHLVVFFIHSHKSRRLGSHQHGALYKSGAFLHRATSAWLCRISSPTRNRTRNFWLEARDDVRFTIEPFANKRKARESNPHHPKVARVSSAARQTVSGCLPIIDVHFVNDSFSSRFDRGAIDDK